MERRRSLIQASMLSRDSDESKRTSASSRRGTMFSQQSQNTLDLIIRDHSVKALSSSELYCVEANKLRDLILDVCACTFCLSYPWFVVFSKLSALLSLSVLFITPKHMYKQSQHVSSNGLPLDDQQRKHGLVSLIVSKPQKQDQDSSASQLCSDSARIE